MVTEDSFTFEIVHMSIKVYMTHKHWCRFGACVFDTTSLMIHHIHKFLCALHEKNGRRLVCDFKIRL